MPEKAVSDADELERTRVQLAGCSVAALGWSKDKEAKPGDYGYSASYQDVLDLRNRWEAERALADRLGQAAEAVIECQNLRNVEALAAAIAEWKKRRPEVANAE